MSTPVIAERLDIHFDIEALRDSLLPLLQSLKPVSHKPRTYRWAVQSTNGSYLDGTSKDFCPYNGPENRGPTWTPRNEVEKSFQPIQAYVQRTELYSKELQNVFDQMKAAQLYPCRGRVLGLDSGGETPWHQDCASSLYQVRAHIALTTNENCFFETDKGRFHIPADGFVYVVAVNQPHRAFNHGTSFRHHLVFNVWDTLKKTRHHQYDASKFLGESYHPADIKSEPSFRVTKG